MGDSGFDEVVVRLRRFIRKRVGSDSDAEDTLQDVLVRLIESDNACRVENTLAWLITVARHAIIDRHRRVRQEPNVVSEHEELATPGDGTSASRELAHCMAPLLRRLRQEERTLLERVDVAGESQHELANELGLPDSTLKSRVQRARRRLLDELTRCCSIELDTRGLPVDFDQDDGPECECGDARQPGRR